MSSPPRPPPLPPGGPPALPPPLPVGPAAWPAAFPPPRHLAREIPPELDRWNWGAFLLNWLWGLGNGTPVALLTWVPVAGWLVMPFVLGARGSAWAWKNGRWDNAAHFRSVQRRWAIWGAVVWLLVIPFFGTVIGGVLYLLTQTPPYRLAVEQVAGSSQAARVLGRPITAGWPTGNVTFGPETGAADLRFSARGPKGRGTVLARARNSAGGWRLVILQLLPDGESRPIDLLTEQRAELRRSPGAAARL